ncbi:MAG: hypothetical protein OXG65_15195 [Chloroflexi bacterium]|nr:hypothetical protein [Chloroflexota bacterium]
MRKLVIGLVVAMVVLALAAPTHALECDGIRLSDGCLFTKTGGDTPNVPDDGYAVTNAGEVPMWDFVRDKDLQALGYPISGRWVEGPFTLQAFQKVILQWDSVNGRMNWYNTLDALANRYPRVELPNVPPHQVLPEDRGVTNFSVIVQNHLALLDANPKIKAEFLAEPNWLNLYGLPIRYEEREVNGNPQGLQLLRAQRIVFEVWNVPAPGTSLGRVGRQNVPDKVKKLSNVIIPNAAKPPITAAQAGDADAVPPTTTPVTTTTPTTDRTPVPSPEPTARTTPVPVSNIPLPRTLPRGLTGFGIQGEFRRPDDGRLGDLITGAGLNWVKQQIPWQEVETRPGVFNWGPTDRFVNTMRGKGLNILLSIVKSPDFYKAEQSKVGTTHGRPHSPETLRDFMREMAARYKGRVQAYEIWNEENLSLEWGTFSNASYSQFIQLLKNGYWGVKESDPNAIVVLGAPTPTGVMNNTIAIDDAIYLQRIFDFNNGEVFNYFEALGVHPNGGPNAPDDWVGRAHNSNAKCGGGWSTHPSFFFDRYKELYNLMAARGHPEKTVWFTEFGWATIDGPGAPAAPAKGYEYAACNSEADQANFFVRSFAKVRAESPYVTHMIMWNLNFQQVVPNTDEKWAFGILRADLSPRPAYNAIKAMPK